MACVGIGVGFVLNGKCKRNRRPLSRKVVAFLVERGARHHLLRENSRRFTTRQFRAIFVGGAPARFLDQALLTVILPYATCFPPFNSYSIQESGAAWIDPCLTVSGCQNDSLLAT